MSTSLALITEEPEGGCNHQNNAPSTEDLYKSNLTQITLSEKYCDEDDTLNIEDAIQEWSVLYSEVFAKLGFKVNNDLPIDVIQKILKHYTLNKHKYTTSQKTESILGQILKEIDENK
ncbi:hypothetical protein MK079_02045 [Candidatus Gracilibacteria bacterium]|nr:hypothetical protein [Candidatus Gracilibacteria bacterium]